MDKPCVLVVDDDQEIVAAIIKLLQLEEIAAIAAYDGLQALDILQSNNIQLIILDIMMPRLDGLSALLKIREKQNIPIILLSAKSEDSDKILGLSMGADDYITKPFNPGELLARVKSQLRRYLHLGAQVKPLNKQQLSIGGLLLDTQTKQLSVDGEDIRLTATEYKILELLMSNPGQVFSAERIYERVWQEPGYNCENTVMVHIRHIREKIETIPKEPKYLKVVWGIGYKIEKI